MFNIPLINQVSFLEKVLLAKNLALMIKSGLPLRESIAVIQEQTKSRTFKKVLDKVIKNIDNGQSLADSLARHPRVFDSLYINMIRIGEESGTLEENLEHLSLQLEKSYQLRQKVQAAMIYPSIILLATIILSSALTLFVLPQIVPIFKSFNIQLPMTTRILIGFTEITQNYGPYILILLAFFIFFLILISRLPAVKLLIHKTILRLPVIGSISRSVSISHFSRTLGILLKSGIPVTEALDITRATLTNLVYQKELVRLTAQVQRGKTISNYLKKKEALFPLMTSRMLSVGEKTGKLDETLSYLGNFYEAEVDKSTKDLSAVLEPILLLTIGLAVGFIALAIISPIYEISRGLHL